MSSWGLEWHTFQPFLSDYCSSLWRPHRQIFAAEAICIFCPALAEDSLCGAGQKRSTQQKSENKVERFLFDCDGNGRKMLGICRVSPRKPGRSAKISPSKARAQSTAADNLPASASAPQAALDDPALQPKRRGRPKKLPAAASAAERSDLTVLSKAADHAGHRSETPSDADDDLHASETGAAQQLAAPTAHVKPKVKARPKSKSATAPATGDDQASHEAPSNKTAQESTSSGRGKKASPTKRKARPQSPAGQKDDKLKGMKPAAKKASPSRKGSSRKNAAEGNSSAASCLELTRFDGDFRPSDDPSAASLGNAAPSGPQPQLMVNAPEPLMARLQRLAAAGAASIPAAAAPSPVTSCHSIPHPSSSSQSPVVLSTDRLPSLQSKPHCFELPTTPKMDACSADAQYTAGTLPLQGRQDDYGCNAFHADAQHHDSWDALHGGHFMDYEPTPVACREPPAGCSSPMGRQFGGQEAVEASPLSPRRTRCSHPAGIAHFAGVPRPRLSDDHAAHSPGRDLQPWISCSQPGTPAGSPSPSVILIGDTPLPPLRPTPAQSVGGPHCKVSKQHSLVSLPGDQPAAASSLTTPGARSLQTVGACLLREHGKMLNASQLCMRPPTDCMAAALEHSMLIVQICDDCRYQPQQTRLTSIPLVVISWLDMDSRKQAFCSLHPLSPCKRCRDPAILGMGLYSSPGVGWSVRLRLSTQLLESREWLWADLTAQNQPEGVQALCPA